MREKLSILILLGISLLGCSKPSHEYQGYIEGENIYLSSPIAGNLLQMLERGSFVKKGDLLATLDPKPQIYSAEQSKLSYLQAQYDLFDLKKPKRPPEIDAIKAQIAQTDAQIRLAAIRLKRNQILFDKRVLDKDSLDATTERLHELEAVKQQFEANLALAYLGARPDQIKAKTAQLSMVLSKLKSSEWLLEQKKIYAPADGQIFDTYYRVGEFISAEHPVLSLLTQDNTKIEFFVPLKALAELKIGKQIVFSYENAKKQYPAVVSYISPEAEYMPPLIYSRENSDKLVFRIRARTKVRDYLIPGEPVIVTIESENA